MDIVRSWSRSDPADEHQHQHDDEQEKNGHDLNFSAMQCRFDTVGVVAMSLDMAWNLLLSRREDLQEAFDIVAEARCLRPMSIRQWKSGRQCKSGILVRARCQREVKRLCLDVACQHNRYRDEAD
jgi:hypothetical protein